MSTAARVQIQMSEGGVHTLIPGDIIGRMPRAALRIEDPRISEAHVLVSLRGADLKLIALRGRMSVDGRPTGSVTLRAGLRVVLAGTLAIEVTHVEVPDQVLALELFARGESVGLFAIEGVMALHPDDPPRLEPRFDPEAPVIVWGNERGICFRMRNTPDRLLAPGEELAIGAVLARVTRVARSALESDPTAEQGSFDVPLTLSLHYDTVHVRPSSGNAVVFDGLAARLLSEVAQLRTPTSWQSIARLIWDDEDDEHVLRYRWDQATSRIRKKLRAARVRADLLRSTGAGLVELYLGPQDRIEDLT